MAVPPKFVKRLTRSRWVRRGAFGLTAVLTLITCIGFLWERSARSAARAAFPPPGEMIDVDGGPLHLNCVGQGQPTVVLEAGASQPSVAWSQVQEGVSEFSRVCSYDRAGIGWSAAAKGDADPEATVRRLRSILTSAEESPPFVLVGHSIGGPLAMIFGDLYPDDVAGYVFVDSADPDRFELLPELQPSETPGVARAIASAISSLSAAVGLTRWQMRGIRKPSHWPDEVFAVAVAFAVQNSAAGTREQLSAPGVVRRAGEVESFGSAPVVVLTARSSLRNEGAPMPPEEWERIRLAMQDAIAARSSNSTRRVVEEVGHNIHLDDASETIRAIRDVVNAVHTGAELSGLGR